MYTETYHKCVYSCHPDDIDCFTQCSRNYHQDIQTCPCQSGCPNGCPCPVYQCPTTTTTSPEITTTTSSTKTSILILSTFQSNRPLITNGAGKVEYPVSDFMFMYGDETEVYHSCSVTWQNQFYIFGGDKKKNQVSMLNGCKLERVGTLTFDHWLGACAAANQKILLCFNLSVNDGKKCRMASSPTGQFSEISSSKFDHQQTRIAVGEGKITYF